ncbi:MAG: DUF1614 domain-containing protein [Bacillota bacterium]
MPRLPIGIIALIIVSILIYFGLAQRLLDRLRISDKTALAVIVAMIAGSFIDIPISFGRVSAAINVGGGIIPIGLAIYVLTRAGTTKEWLRALIATGVTGGVIYFVGTYIMTGNPGDTVQLLDPLYVYPIVGGLIAYIAGRSRRSAFVAATLGVLLLDVFNYIYLVTTGTPGRVHVGGAGAFDSIILAGLVAVLLAELIGETRERLQGGPASKGRPKELLKNLENAEYASSIGLEEIVEQVGDSKEEEEQKAGDRS